MSDAEQWKPVPDWPEYEASDLGRVRNMKTKHVLRPAINPKTGYPAVNLWRGDRGHTTTVHTIVARAFHGPPPSSKHQVAHNNGVRTDCVATNLRWATRKDNMADCVQHGSTGRGRSETMAADDILAIRRRRAAGDPLKDIAQDYGISIQTVCDISKRRRWGWVPEQI